MVKGSLSSFATLLLLTILAHGFALAQTSKDGPMAKLPHSLVALHQQFTTQITQSGAAPFSSKDPLVRMVEDRVVVDAVASDDVNVLKSELEALGMQQAVAFGRVVSGQLPVSALPAAAGLASLRFARPAAAMTRAGLVTSQGDQAMRSDAARTKFRVNGTGVNVGVVSDQAFNCLGGAAADVADGDLSPVAVLQEEPDCSSGTDEGRAMLQIVHDLAPGASLLFATADNGIASFAQNIQTLAALGTKVIVDDVILFRAHVSDGIIAQAVDNVVATGVAYFSAAGNDARNAYSSAFRPGTVFRPGTPLPAWGPVLFRRDRSRF